ncbi:hypothetical protein DRQ21_02300 [Candidatus Fermentibacteria bacterium]|nr:MAG: hypothetical protein DRQ21_02300 [Candidatus Fermentibacteria bacterium]
MMEIDLVLALAMSFIKAFPGFSQAVLSNYLHPESQISAELDPEEFSQSTACWAAAHHLVQAGVEDIRICEVTRIEAPVSGYLVDATGSWVTGGDTMSVFRTGVFDGYEQVFEPGEQFVFLAAGVTKTGEIVVFPAVTPGGSGFVEEYEFLGDTEDFLELSRRFPD